MNYQAPTLTRIEAIEKLFERLGNEKDPIHKIFEGWAYKNHRGLGMEDFLQWMYLALVEEIAYEQMPNGEWVAAQTDSYIAARSAGRARKHNFRKGNIQATREGELTAAYESIPDTFEPSADAEQTLIRYYAKATGTDAADVADYIYGNLNDEERMIAFYLMDGMGYYEIEESKIASRRKAKRVRTQLKDLRKVLA